MRTPLHIACAEGLLPIVKLLLQFRANPHIRDRFGTTPLDEAKKLSNNVAVAEFMDDHQAAIDNVGRSANGSESHEIFQMMSNTPRDAELIGTVPADELPPRRKSKISDSAVRARPAAGIATSPHAEGACAEFPAMISF
jgi:hypothetical protein